MPGQLFCSTGLPLARTRRVWSTFSSPVSSNQRRRRTSAKLIIFPLKIFGTAGNQTRGCLVISKHATSVQCSPPTWPTLARTPHPIPPRPRCGSSACNGAASLSPRRLKRNKKPNMDQNRKSKSFMKKGWWNVGQPNLFDPNKWHLSAFEIFLWLGHKLGFFIYCIP